MDITVLQADITRLEVDAIVNAANAGLLGGGGVDGAIHRAAGPELLAECRELRRARFPGGLPVGEAAATGAGRLPARWVIHTVGPNRRAGQADPKLLENCFRRSCEVAADLGARSVAFPAIGGGVYGWAAEDVAAAAVAGLAAAAAGLAAAGPNAAGRRVPRMPESVVLVAFAENMARAFRGAVD